MQILEVQFLKDEYINKKGEVKEVPWKHKKRRSNLLAQSYLRQGNTSKASRVFDCGTFLDFKEFEDGTKKLHLANFCKIRLCPMCIWRRSKKVFAQVSKIMQHMTEHHDYRYIFLTTTFRNMDGRSLPDAIDSFMDAFNKMTKTKEFKKLSKGFFRALELTTKRHDDYHPHMHVIIAVNKSYFHRGGNSGYLTHEAWKNLWRSCADLDYDPWVYIEKVKPDNGTKVEDEKTYQGAVAELSKYTLKDAEVIIDPYQMVFQGADGKYHKMYKNTSEKGFDELKKWVEEMTDERVFTVDKALKGRRLISFGGKFREAHKLLNLDDPAEGDLIHTGNEDELREDLSYVIKTYRWSIEYMDFTQYSDAD